MYLSLSSGPTTCLMIENQCYIEMFKKTKIAFKQEASIWKEIRTQSSSVPIISHVELLQPEDCSTADFTLSSTNSRAFSNSCPSSR